MRTRYAITKVTEDGLRVLARPNQGRNHFDSETAAGKHLTAILKNNSPRVLSSVYGDFTKMKVMPVECYDHGDAVGSVIGIEKEEDPVPDPLRVAAMLCGLEVECDGGGYRLIEQDMALGKCYVYPRRDQPTRSRKECRAFIEGAQWRKANPL